MFALREPVGTDIYYSPSKDSLLKEVEASIEHPFGPGQIKTEKFIASVVPHDRITLSGPTAAWVYASIEKKNYIIIGPNHNQIGTKFAVMREGIWKTPLGEVAVDTDIAQKMIEEVELVQYDVLAHKNEHAIEVQLPFLQYRFGNDFKIVPMLITNSFRDVDFIAACVDIGKRIAGIIRADTANWGIIGTSDMSSGALDVQRKADKILVRAILSLKPTKIFEAVDSTNAHICGYGAMITTIAAAKELGAKKAKLLQYTSSYDILQEASSVTGYASLIIY